MPACAPVSCCGKRAGHTRACHAMRMSAGEACACHTAASCQGGSLRTSEKCCGAGGLACMQHAKLAPRLLHSALTSPHRTSHSRREALHSVSDGRPPRTVERQSAGGHAAPALLRGAHLGAVEVGRPVDSVEFQVRQQHGRGDGLQPALRIAHGRRRVVVQRAKVAVARDLPAHQCHGLQQEGVGGSVRARKRGAHACVKGCSAGCALLIACMVSTKWAAAAAGALGSPLLIMEAAHPVHERALPCGNAHMMEHRLGRSS